MAFDSRGGTGTIAQINVTPLVDVMLVLLVIFMVTAPIIQQGVSVDLPKTRAAGLNSQEDPLVVGLTKDGVLYLVQELLDGSDLSKRLDREPQRRLRSDEALAILVPVKLLPWPGKMPVVTASRP